MAIPRIGSVGVPPIYTAAAMGSLPFPARLFLLTVMAVGLSVLGLAAASLAPATARLPELGFFLALVVAADLATVSLSHGGRYSVATAINFAAVLLFGVPAGSCIAALGALAGDVLVKRPWYRAGFNGAAIGLATGAGGLAYAALRPLPAQPLNSSDLMAGAAYVVVHFLVNVALVCTALGLIQQRRPWDIAVANFRDIGLPMLALYPLGLLMAVGYTYFGQFIGLFLVIAPTIVVYHAINGTQVLRRQTRQTLEVLADTIDRRDKYTAEHSQRVARYAEQIAQCLGLGLREVEAIAAAAHVHDLGKVSTPDSVLLKPGQLTDDEWDLMRKHPAAGAAILQSLSIYRDSAQFVGLHHERADGHGYPGGVGGQAIPLGAHIIAVADAFDAMTSDRPYRPALAVQQAIQELRKGRGTQFSAEVVDAFIDALAAVAARNGRASANDHLPANAHTPAPAKRRAPAPQEAQ